MYQPNIEHAHVPENAGWTVNEEKNVLLLSIPSFPDVEQEENTLFDYAWLFDPKANAYVFCYKFESGEERGIMFPYEHAGQMLLKDEANGPFDVVITLKPFESLTDEDSFIWLNDIELERISRAKW